MKFCKDCKHRGDGDICNAPKNMKTQYDIVTGKEEIVREWTYCSTHRLHPGILYVTMFKQCGRRGRWFETKE
ncbi:hypothetical protein [Burkholderia latens]|uniref:hypothetical protein n=1 Tax=Burkholderia latens TaxID=488446 RepID=UPI001AE6A250|nr:hypothetical protein [Burkholderia latens]QTO46340.1 hypothetical protein J8I85_18010 [Burkholderia latens]